MNEQQRFWFTEANIRGQMVQLAEPWQQTRERYDYPTAVAELLGQAMAASCLMVATIKMSGYINVQIQAEGPLRLLVVQADSDGRVRGLARWNEDGDFSNSDLQSLCQNGRFSITIEPDKGQRYQGIVALDKPTLAEVLGAYFQQSEQLNTRFWLHADEQHAAGMLLQQMPDSGDKALAIDPDAWNRATVLADTLTANELLTNDPLTLLHKLFSEENVKAAPPTVLSFRCQGCDLRVEQALRGLGEAELLDALKESDGNIEVGCEFCIRKFNYDGNDVQRLLQNPETHLH